MAMWKVGRKVAKNVLPVLQCHSQLSDGWPSNSHIFVLSSLPCYPFPVIFGVLSFLFLSFSPSHSVTPSPLSLSLPLSPVLPPLPLTLSRRLPAPLRLTVLICPDR